MSRIKKHRYACIALILLAPAFVCAEEISDLFSRAVENDTQHSILAITLNTKRIIVDRTNLPDRMSFKASAGATVNQTLGESGATVITIGPNATLGLAEPLSTSINVSSPVTLTIADATDTIIEPAVTITQPLNELLGLEQSERATQIAELTSIEKARIDLAAREVAVKKTVLSNLKSVISSLLAIEELTITANEAETEFTLARTLGTYNVASASYKALELAAERARTGVELAEARYRKALDTLARTVGSQVTIPDSINVPDIDLPGDENLDVNPGAYLARLDLEKFEARLALLEAPYIPTLSAGLTYALDETAGNQTHSVGGSFGLGLKNLSIQAGVNGGFGSSDTIGGTLSVSLSLPDDRAENMRISEARNAMEIGRLKVEQAVFSFRAGILSLEERAENLDLAEKRLEEDRALATLRLNEVTGRYDSGIASEEALESARWGLEKLDYTERLQIIDRYTVFLDTMSLALMSHL